MLIIKMQIKGRFNTLFLHTKPDVSKMEWNLQYVLFCKIMCFIHIIEIKTDHFKKYVIFLQS